MTRCYLYCSTVLNDGSKDHEPIYVSIVPQLKGSSSFVCRSRKCGRRRQKMSAGNMDKNRPGKTSIHGKVRRHISTCKHVNIRIKKSFAKSLFAVFYCMQTKVGPCEIIQNYATKRQKRGYG